MPGKSLSHWGTVCSTWVFMNRANTKRFQSAPLGVEPRSQSVMDANRMVSVMCLMWLWSATRKIINILEQPSTSLMRWHPRLLQVRDHFGQDFHMISTFMGAYGGPTAKPSHLYSDADFVRKLHRKCTDDDKVRFHEEGHQNVTRTETGGVCGGRDLKGSQAYPVEYGQQVATEFAKHLSQSTFTGIEDAPSSDEETESEHDDWADANLGELCAWLRIPADRLMI